MSACTFGSDATCRCSSSLIVSRTDSRNAAITSEPVEELSADPPEVPGLEDTVFAGRPIVAETDEEGADVAVGMAVTVGVVTEVSELLISITEW